LLDFTGSDWCGYCIKLDEEVFSKPSFKKFAKENLVLVELDYPRGKNLPKKTKEQNDSLKSKYGISGYPTIILLDSDGKEAARWIGYKATLLDELKDKVKTPGKESAK
jgi:thioredoxin-related protein